MIENTRAHRIPACARIICCSLLAFFFANVGTVDAAAQDRAIVRIVVRSSTGDSLPYARLHAKIGGKDTVARGNERGLAALILPRGTYSIAANALGYQSRQADIRVTSDTSVTITLERTTQQLANVDVIAKWIGIRGIVGDSTTMQALAGATVQETTGERRKVITDSVGRFEIPLAKAVPVVLRVELKGYLSRTAYVSLSESAHSPETIVFLNAGKDHRSTATALFDFTSRAPWMGTRSFMMSRDELTATGQQNVESALLSSGILTQRGLVMSETLCVYVNGIAAPMRALSFYRSKDVEFLEVWATGSEETRTLERDWPRGAMCGRTSQLPSRAWSGSILKYAVVWLKQ